jgi:regulator of sigma E protease
MTVFLLIVGLVLFVGLVVAHEWGHFKVARRNGVGVEEFGIGLPPKVWGKRVKSGFEFTINALPLGGFVRLKGENDSDKTPGSFGAAPLWPKTKIMLAGVGMNLIIAYVLFVLLALAGMPKLIDGQFSVPSDTKTVRQVANQGVVLVAEVPGGTPAANAGIKSGDEIVSINGESINNPGRVGELTAANAGEQISVLIKMDGKMIDKQIRLNEQNSGQGYLGLVSESGESGIQVDRYTWSAPVVAGGITAQFTKLTLKGIGTALGNLVRGNTQKASEQVAGPVGIFVILREGTSLGINFVLMIIAIISLTLAIFNALPIPALDGGRLFVTLFFRAVRRPLTKSKENFIHGTGFLVLITLLVLLTIVDVNRFF